ncbi:unnamed protein product [Somion occarium]
MREGGPSRKRTSERPNSSSERPNSSSDRQRSNRPRPQFATKPRVDEEKLPSVLKLPDPTGTTEVLKPSRRPRVNNPLSEEFELSPKAVSTQQLPSEFSSPPLMESLLSSIMDILGPNARPTPIQALSLKHLFSPSQGDSQWRQFLLASETGSGKSIAYLLPMLQDLKQTELDGTVPRLTSKRLMAPRALVLAPTHELSRQLSVFAKSLLHNTKLRVLCASRANAPTQSRRHVTASKMASDIDSDIVPEEGGEFIVSSPSNAAKPVDVLVCTPSRVLEMEKGRGWDYEHKEHPEDIDENGRNIRPNRKFTVGPPEITLANVDWVVVDEADVLFDPDFQESTRLLLADIATAKGKPVAFTPELNLSSTTTEPAPSIEVPKYPFNLILTTATIPSSLASYLDTYHPSLMRLASPNLHKLPSTLQTEYESWTGGRRNKDVENRIRRVWWEDAIAAGRQATSESVISDTSFEKSKVLIFCNKSTKVEELGKYLTERGIPNIALTSTSDSRHKGNNHHLDGFLRECAGGQESSSDASAGAEKTEQPHVLITTSLLSRGLDFSPSIKHVFIMDAPRNMVDFLHRAGRSGRAGEQGKVVVFGKSKGRGAGKDREVKSRVKALIS